MARKKSKQAKRQTGSSKKKGHSPNNAPRTASFDIEALEPRILLSATWVDTDTGDAISGATEGNDTFTGGDGANIADGLGGVDLMSGGDGNDQLFGGAGNDTLFGNDGNDTLDGGAGDDLIQGDDGSDVLISGGGNDTLQGDDGADTFQFTGSQSGDVVTVDGGEGSDTINLTEFGSSAVTQTNANTITVNLQNGGSFQINHSNMETLVTSDGQFSLDGSSDGSGGGSDSSESSGSNGGSDSSESSGSSGGSDSSESSGSSGGSDSSESSGSSGGSDSSESSGSSGGNVDPLANAGVDQTINEGSTVTLDASSSTDANGDSLAYSWTQVQGPTVTLSDNTAAQPTFTAPDVTGPTTLTFSVTADDGNGGQTTDLVNIVVDDVAINDAPDAFDDVVTTGEDGTVTTANVLANDTDADGDTLSITGFSQAANGNVVSNNDGTFTYTPNANFAGNDSFTYTVDDGNGGTDTATINVAVSAKAAQPNDNGSVSVSLPTGTNEDTNATLDVPASPTVDQQTDDMEDTTPEIDAPISDNEPAEDAKVESLDTPTGGDANLTDTTPEPIVDNEGSQSTTVESSTVTSDNSTPQDRQPIEWDGSEDLSVLNATDDLGDDLELARGEHAIMSEIHAATEAENNDDAVLNDFEVVDDFALESSIASLNESLNDVTFDGAESFEAMFEPSGEVDSDSILVGHRGGSAEYTIQSESAEDDIAQVDHNLIAENIDADISHPEEINADASGNSELHSANSSVVTADETEQLAGEANDSSFFARLWGAVRGMGGTKQRSQIAATDEDNAKRN